MTRWNLLLTQYVKWRTRSMKWLCSAKNLFVLSFRPLLMLLPSPVGIRDADHPEQRFLQLDDHTEYGNLKFVTPECLWFAKTLTDFEINDIAAALLPLFCYNS